MIHKLKVIRARQNEQISIREAHTQANRERERERERDNKLVYPKSRGCFCVRKDNKSIHEYN